MAAELLLSSDPQDCNEIKLRGTRQEGFSETENTTFHGFPVFPIKTQRWTCLDKRPAGSQVRLDVLHSVQINALKSGSIVTEWREEFSPGACASGETGNVQLDYNTSGTGPRGISEFYRGDGNSGCRQGDTGTASPPGFHVHSDHMSQASGRQCA